MAIFPNLETEATIQVHDRTRLSAIKTYASKDGPAIAVVEIQPEAAGPWITVTGTKPADWYTDWQYATAGTKTITLRINQPTTPVISTFTTEVITAAADMLFCTDADLQQEEPDVLKYVKDGRNSFKDVHREAQKEILDLLDRKGYRCTDGTKITAAEVVDLSEVRTMAKYLALHLIYSGQSNIIDDIHRQKANLYWSKYLVARDRQVIGLDLNKDGDVSNGEGVVIASALMVQK